MKQEFKDEEATSLWADIVARVPGAEPIFAKPLRDGLGRYGFGVSIGGKKLAWDTSDPAAFFANVEAGKVTELQVQEASHPVG